MSKELETLREIKKAFSWCIYDSKTVGQYDRMFNTVEQALKNYETIICAIGDVFVDLSKEHYSSAEGALDDIRRIMNL